MLPEIIHQSLLDIVDCIAAIDETLNELMGERRDFGDYMKKRYLRRAVEREIEIIGEATKRIMHADPDFKLKNARQIIGTRNWVIHTYEKIDDTIIWGIVINHLPPLRAEVEKLLAQ